MMGLVTDGKMPPDQAFKGCMMLSVSFSVFLLGVGGFVLLLSKAGCL